MASDPWEPPTLLQQICNPIILLTLIVEYVAETLRPDRRFRRGITVVCISDTHCLIPEAEIPFGDILIHTGDLSNKGTPAELQAQFDWLSSLPHRHKIAIAGNHDTWLDPRSRQTLDPLEQNGSVDRRDVVYLQDESVTLDFAHRSSTPTRSVKIYGAPHIPACGGADFAFQYPRGQNVWEGRIPSDADIVVTHTPMKYHLDLPGGSALGDEFLPKELRRVRPMLHCFGHVHAGRSDWSGKLRDGQQTLRWDQRERWYDEIMTRQSSRRPSSRLLDLHSWVLLAQFTISGMWNAAYDLLFGLETSSTRLVNASLMYRNTGRLLNPPQVVHL